MQKTKICHITTVHPRYDVRIFHKECKTLSQNYEVILLVADGKGNETIDGVSIIDIGLRQTSRLKRMRIDAQKAFEKALQLNAQIYHFHDPELMTIGLKLKKQGKVVIYDVHEDLPRQILGKPYLNKWIKPFLSKIVEYKENKAARQFDYIVAATPHIRNRFLQVNQNTIDVNNYPLLDLLPQVDFEKKQREICYVGGLDENRGIYELIESLKYSKVRLNLAGSFDSFDFETKCKQSEGWQYVHYYGFVDRKEVAEILKRSYAGMVTLRPLVNYLDALPVKMFEYMMAGLPVVASNFKLWENILSENKCGVVVNPLAPKEIAEKVLSLLNDVETAKQMGQNGQKAVKEKYNWGIEGKKLLRLYENLI